MTAYPTLFRAAGVALAVVCLGVARVSPAAQAATAELEHFEKKVRPLLVKYCFKCHGPKEEEADLRLDSRAAVLRGGDSGPAIEPGRPSESRLIRAIGYSDPDLQMPPKKKLSARQIADLTRWVKAGAPWPGAKATTEPSVASGAIQRPKITDEQRKFWAFRPVVDRTPPKLADESWATSPIDRFIGRALDAKGLKPAPPADKRTLLRRIYFDLIGLPPAPEEIKAFCRRFIDAEAARQARRDERRRYYIAVSRRVAYYRRPDGRRSPDSLNGWTQCTNSTTSPVANC